MNDGTQLVGGRTLPQCRTQSHTTHHTHYHQYRCYTHTLSHYSSPRILTCIRLVTATASAIRAVIDSDSLSKFTLILFSFI